MLGIGENRRVGLQVADIDALEREVGVVAVMREVAFAAADEVVHHSHAIIALEQAVDHMAADKAGAAGDDGDGCRRHFAPIFFMVRTL